jgi:YD repeat-containing protein
MAIAKRVFFGILISLQAVYLSAQLNGGTETGLPPNSVFHGSGIDKVNLQNGYLHIEIPLLSLPQRGGHTLVWKFVYSSPQWNLTWVPTQVSPDFGYYVTQGGSSGWFLESPYKWSAHGTQTTVTCTANNNQYIQTTNWVVSDPEGTQHLMPLRIESSPCLGQILSGPASDGSGIFYNWQTNIITLKDGTQIKPSYPLAPPSSLPVAMQDANGNQFTSQDTIGRAGLTAADAASVQYTSPLGHNINGPQYTQYLFLDSNGTQQSYRVDYVALDVLSDICTMAGTYTCYGSGGTFLAPRQLTLPNGTAYTFSYNNNTPGELQQMTLPTGATIAYTYSDAYFSNGFQRLGRSSYSGQEGVSSRTVTVGGVASQWTYGAFENAGLPRPSVAVTDPLGNIETHSFGYVCLGSQGCTTSVYETGVAYAGPTGNPLRTVSKTYTSELDPVRHIPVNVRVISEATTLDNGQSKSSQTDYETFTYSCGTIACPPGMRLNPTEVREYDFGGALLRRTDYTYLHTNNQTYKNLNIVDKPTTIITYDGSGNKVAETINEYDIYSHTSQPMLASGAMQHASSFGTSYTTRGNVTAIEHWRSTDNTFLTSTDQYDDSGNLLSTIDPKGNRTSFDYTDSWSNTTCAPSSSGKAFLTKVTNALSQIATKTYDSCTGATASTTDANGNQTSFAYDAMGRTLSVTDPLQTVNGSALHGVTTYIYTDTPNSVNVEKKDTIDGSRSTDEFFYFDGLGRGISHSRANGQGTPWDKSDTCYDLNGRKSFSSYPYQASSTTPSASCPSEAGDTFAYDALSRISTVTHSDSTVITTTYTGRATDVVDEGNGNASASERVSQIDGLGHLVSVCEVTSAVQKGLGGTPAACGQDIAKTGFLTTYAYDILGNVLSVAQGSMGARSFTYDSLSHVITSANPESGTTCYGTWSGSTCVNGYDADGNLLSLTRPAPNQTSNTIYVTTSYTYDALNRPTSRSYSDGTTPKVM